MKRLFLAVAAAAGLATALPAAAQFAKPEDAIKYRKAAFTVMASHFGRVAAMANGRIPFDAKAAASNAEIANMMAALPYAAFGEGTDKGDTRAKAEIWSERDKFNAGATKMQEEMAKLNAAAKSGDQAAMRTAAGAVGQACKACHDTYRRD
ncbi:cytochrome c [Rhizobacter sp. J219]|uniref:c-type cytochrome n=1 Tax=Rhizobacter sp. J219 TaxID=2898430 RepID=UPI002150FD4B|nr:cytochrome c [Rhizobacter sp. J219]MCR5884300.1 cytochrome c [Rhizobacter sp. J219]